jgi:hypothetical protein
MSQINDGGPAFPLAYTETNAHGVQFPFTHPGMSLRQWYATHAMSALAVRTLDAAREAGETPPVACNILAAVSFAIADAMLASDPKGGGHG